MTATEIRLKLESVVGVVPSDEWLAACVDHLSLTNEATADAVMSQILHSDLRDVVRHLANNDTDVQSGNRPSALMRNAVQQSMMGERRKETLATEFRLMVQVEELLDVSLNAEARYSLGPASATAPTPVGNQRTRLLKLYTSDGHLPPVHLIAMETAPIQNLSVHSLAGIKVLIRGPIEIRHGILQLNPSNVTVLGGSVVDLVDIQRKALEQARRHAGVGVDPTVKALCWNSADDALLIPDQDEGELSSEDVVASPAQRPQRSDLPIITPQVSRNLPFNQPQIHHRTPIEPRGGGHSIPPSQPQVRTHQTQLQPFPGPLVPRLAALKQSSLNNPYARTSKTLLPTASATQDSGGAGMVEPAIITAASSNHAIVSTDENRSSMQRKHPALNTIATCKPTIDATQSSQESGDVVREHLSFEELITLMQRIIQDRGLYKKYQCYVFVVQAKMKGRHVYFNIEKKKKRRKNDEKYEYVMNSHFVGQNGGQLLTVLVDDSILRPHFHLAPGVMRQLSREDRSASQRLVEEGGTSVIAALSKLQQWELRLCHTEEDFFATPIATLDQDQPIMRVLKLSS